MLWENICIAEKRAFNWVSLSGLLTVERERKKNSPEGVSLCWIWCLKEMSSGLWWKLNFSNAWGWLSLTNLAHSQPLNGCRHFGLLWISCSYPAFKLFDKLLFCLSLPCSLCSSLFHTPDFLLYISPAFFVNWKVPNLFPFLDVWGKSLSTRGTRIPHFLTDGMSLHLILIFGFLQTCRETGTCHLHKVRWKMERLTVLFNLQVTSTSTETHCYAHLYHLLWWYSGM